MGACLLDPLPEVIIVGQYLRLISVTYAERIAHAQRLQTPTVHSTVRIASHRLAPQPTPPRPDHRRPTMATLALESIISIPSDEHPVLLTEVCA